LVVMLHSSISGMFSDGCFTDNLPEQLPEKAREAGDGG
jgi:hypothetical protein